MSKFVETKMVDNRGTVLYIGAKVAFNLSGEVAHGQITAMKAGGVDGSRYKKSTIKITRSFPNNAHSVVTSPKNVMVLFEEAEWQPMETVPKYYIEFLGLFSNGEVHVVAINEEDECYRELDPDDAFWEMPVSWMPLPPTDDWMDNFIAERKKARKKARKKKK